jgi:hypothetical protein
MLNSAKLSKGAVMIWDVVSNSSRSKQQQGKKAEFAYLAMS